MKTIVAGCVLALLVAACAPMSVDPGQMQAVKRIAVFSTLGDRFTIKKIGITVFQNEQKEMPIQSWRIDDFVVGKVRSVLNGRFELRPAAFQRSAFAAARDASQIAAAVRAQATARDVDAYIIVTAASSRFGDSNQILDGLGILQTSNLIATNAYVYALYWFTVIDGHNFSVVAGTSAYALGENLLTMKAIRGPSREVAPSWIPQTLDAGQNQRLKTVVTELLDQNLAGTVQNLKLLQ
ncbi:MAG TPA: hypothetical protein VGG01_00245 [Xanthobacteraceae bacterium]|jgi:hypothetical protein